MWMTTPHGFYSAVENPLNPTQVVVRARAEADLVSLGAHYCPEADPIISTPTRDYAYRVFISKDAWATAVARMALNIDYGNFKDEVARLDKERATVYAGVWAKLLDIQYPWDGGRQTLFGQYDDWEDWSAEQETEEILNDPDAMKALAEAEGERRTWAPWKRRRASLEQCW